MIGIDGKYMRLPQRCSLCFASADYGCGIMHVTMTTDEMDGRPSWCPLCEMRERKITEKTSHTNYKTSTVWEIVE